VGVDDVRPLTRDEVAYRPAERDDHVFDVVAKTPNLARAPMLRVHYDSIAFERVWTRIRKSLQKAHLVAAAGELSREIGHVLLGPADGRIAVGID
jgi:hypothetical protein